MEKQFKIKHSTCGLCKRYIHKYFHDWSSTNVPFITSMTICQYSSDGYVHRGYNCVACDNFILKPAIPFFDFNEVLGEQLSLF